MNSQARAVLYHRVSTRDQNPELAREELARAAEARGYQVVETVEETGSGARNDRPGLKRLWELVRRSEVEAVLVWKLDRFGRSVLDVLANLQQLKAAGIRFICTSQGLEVSPQGDAVSNLLLHVLSAVAEFERSLIAERTALGLDRARRKGKRLGRPPVTTQYAEERAARLRAQGCSWREVAGEMSCTISAARRAVARVESRCAEKGPRSEGGELPENTMADEVGPETNDFDMENEVAHGDERPS